jgi:hypothetical protein
VIFRNGTLDLRDDTITDLAQFMAAIDTFRMDRFDKVESVRLSIVQERNLNKEVSTYMFSGNAKDLEKTSPIKIKTLMGYELLIDEEDRGE